MRDRTATRLAWTLFALAAAILALASWLSVAAGDPSSVLPFLPALLTFAGVGALVASRRPRNPLGWLMLGMGAMGLGLLAAAYAQYELTRSPSTAAWAAWVFVISIEVGTIPLTFILLLFPHGTLLSRRWLIVAWGAVLFPLAAGVCTAISDVNFSTRTNFPTLRDPVQLVSSTAVQHLYTTFQTANLLVILAAAASLALRFRRSSGEERLQLKWIAAAGLLAAAGFLVLANIPNGPEPVLAFIILVPLIPIAAGIAILKYRLYDIDVVINKTVVYAGLAGFITAVYVAIVVGLGALIGAGTSKPNLGLSILATAVVAVAFQPVRSRVQRFANRLVYGERATPYEVLSEFSQRMGGSYATEDVLPRMARILAEGTGATATVVWLKVGEVLRAAATWPEGAMVGDSILVGDPDHEPDFHGATASYLVHHRGELLGALSLSKAPGDRLKPAEEHLSGDLAAGAGLVLRNVRLTEELRARLVDLQASRQRIVAAADDARRKLERDIHDGAQQQLVALSVKAGLAERLMASDPGKGDQFLAQMEVELADALQDLRDLARGIYPPLLADQGLAAAIRAQARKAAFAVELDAVGVDRYPMEVEAAAYFCVLEALQNVGKYANANAAVVRLRQDEDALAFTVMDDGVGFDPRAKGYGTGMEGMADRLSALGGELRIESAPGVGATVIGRIPVRTLEAVG